MTEERKNAFFRIFILFSSIALSFGVLFIIWNSFNPEKTIPWLNFFVTILGFSVAYISIPKVSKLSETSWREWLLVILSLMIAILSFALYGLSIDWLRNLSLWELVSLLVVCLIFLTIIYFISRFISRFFSAKQETST